MKSQILAKNLYKYNFFCLQSSFSISNLNIFWKNSKICLKLNKTQPKVNQFPAKFKLLETLLLLMLEKRLNGKPAQLHTLFKKKCSKILMRLNVPFLKTSVLKTFLFYFYLLWNMLSYLLTTKITPYINYFLLFSHVMQWVVD